VIASMAALSVVGGRAGAGVTHPAEPARTQIYVVRPGDTVWSIAEGLAGPGADPRSLVDRLIAANHVSNGLVTIGERLMVPPGG
jgi:Tfp pilus assembly protein FimV